MPERLAVGLDAWIVQDGNYGDFRRGDRAAFALQFYAAHGLRVLGSGNATGRSLTHKGGALHEASGKVIHAAEGWWAVDFGVPVFREEPPPRGARPGAWVRGEVRIGVDPFPYFERLAREADAPALIHDWTVAKIEMQTAPFVRVAGGYMTRDPARLGWKEVARTDAWRHDGGRAEYLLHCERHDGPARRTLAG